MFPYLQFPCVAGLMILRTLRTNYATYMRGVRGPFRWLLQLTMHTLLLVGLEFIIWLWRRCIATLPAACTTTPMEAESMSKFPKCTPIWDPACIFCSITKHYSAEWASKQVSRLGGAGNMSCKVLESYLVDVWFDPMNSGGSTVTEHL